MQKEQFNESEKLQIQDLVKAIASGKAPQQSPLSSSQEEPKRRPEDYVPGQLKDDDGLVVDSPHYASQKCRDCYGRGVMRRVIMDGKVGQVFDDPTFKDGTPKLVKNPGRLLTPCNCVIRTYVKVRAAFNKGLPAYLERYGKDGMGNDVSEESKKLYANEINASCA